MANDNLNYDLKAVDTAINELEKQLIKDIQQMGLYKLDLQLYIDKLEVLKLKKSQIQFKILMNS